MPGIYDGSWRLLWHHIRVHLDAAAQHRAELLVMRAMHRKWNPEKLRRLLKKLIEKAPKAAPFSERRNSLRDHASAFNFCNLSRANGRGSAGQCHASMTAKTPAGRDTVQPRVAVNASTARRVPRTLRGRA